MSFMDTRYRTPVKVPYKSPIWLFGNNNYICIHQNQ